MAGARLLGIDIGTTGVRAAVFDDAGSLLADASTPCAYEAPEPGWAEIGAARWWEAVVTVLGELATRPAIRSLADVSAIAVVGQAPTIVLVDAATQRPRRISPEERAAWAPYAEAPVAFSRRR